MRPDDPGTPSLDPVLPKTSRNLTPPQLQAVARRALVEVRSLPDEGNALLRAMGVHFPRGQRVVQQPADATTARIERYLRETEQLVPERLPEPRRSIIYFLSAWELRAELAELAAFCMAFG